MMKRNRYRSPLFAIGSALVVFAGCAEQPDDADRSLRDIEDFATTPIPALQAASQEPRAPGDLFPATGNRGLVLNNCDSCHAVVCVTLGQRDRTEWRDVEESHIDAVPGLSIEDRGKIFDYLRRHFNESLPEPMIPEDLLQGGCP